jgi:hypothetical protein
MGSFQKQQSRKNLGEAAVQLQQFGSHRIQKFVLCCVVTVLVVFIVAVDNNESTPLAASSLLSGLTVNASNGNARVIRKELSAEEFTLIFELTPSQSSLDDTSVSTGDHTAQIVIRNKDCENPNFYLRLVGEALVPILLTQNDGSTSRMKKQEKWSGRFSIPVQGKYFVEARWYGCDEERTPDWIPLQFPIEIHAVGARALPEHTSKESYLFADSIWLSTSSITNTEKLALPDYVWVDPSASNDPSFISLPIKDMGGTIATTNGTFKEPHQAYRFAETGNYVSRHLASMNEVDCLMLPA